MAYISKCKICGHRTCDSELCNECKDSVVNYAMTVDLDKETIKKSSEKKRSDEMHKVLREEMEKLCNFSKIKRQRVGIIMMVGCGGDTYFKLCSEEDYNIVINHHPTKKYKSRYKDEEEDVLDVDAYNEFVGKYFYDSEKDDNNDRVLEWWSTQTYVPESIDLSKYEIIGILSMPC